VQGNTTERR